MSQVPAEVPQLPRLPELYLEAGAALLMSLRPADCVMLCEEVISTTQDVLPEKLMLELEEQNESETRDMNDKMAMLLWTATAYLLQGHCYTHLKDWRQAVIHYTRSGRYRFCISSIMFCMQTHNTICVNVTGVSTCW